MEFLEILPVSAITKAIIIANFRSFDTYFLGEIELGETELGLPHPQLGPQGELGLELGLEEVSEAELTFGLASLAGLFCL